MCFQHRFETFQQQFRNSNVLGIRRVLPARGASYHIKGKIYKARVQSVLTYGTETWEMKVVNLRRLERAERMMVRWMCIGSLNDRKFTEDLYNLLGIQSVVDVMRRGMRWFEHLEHKNEDDWASVCSKRWQGEM